MHQPRRNHSYQLTLDQVPAFEEWASSNHSAKPFDLKFIRGCTIGIDVAHFLDNIPQEALSSALGGTPLALESTVLNTVGALGHAGLKLHFVFNGLASGVGEDSSGRAAKAASLNNNAFKLYEEKHLTEAYKNYGFSCRFLKQLKTSNHCSSQSALSDTSAVMAQLQRILHEHNIPFTVAPYSALAQVSWQLLLGHNN